MGLGIGSRAFGWGKACDPDVCSTASHLKYATLAAFDMEGLATMVQTSMLHVRVDDQIALVR